MPKEDEPKGLIAPLKEQAALAAEAVSPANLAKFLEATSVIKDCLASCNPPSQAEEMDEMWNHLGALEKFLTKSFAQKQKQATILNFFTPPSAAGPLMPEEEPRV